MHYSLARRSQERAAKRADLFPWLSMGIHNSRYWRLYAGHRAAATGERHRRARLFDAADDLEAALLELGHGNVHVLSINGHFDLLQWEA